MNATFILIIGLIIFLGAHSIRILADDWRSIMLARIGELGWKGLIAVVSLLGFGLIIWGFGMTRAEPVVLWQPPFWTRHLAALLTLPAFVLLVAAYVPGNRIKSVIGHPMVAGVKVWALAHLLANGRLADLLLFGSFLIWAAFSFRTARRRDRATAVTYPAGPLSRTIIVVVIGIAAWAIFVMKLHGLLIGVRPFG
ncbi:MAG: NnrU family protein [Georgfuchsia sp.]